MKKKGLLIIGSILLLLLIVGAIVFLMFDNQKVKITFMDDNKIIGSIKIKKGSTIQLPTMEKEGYILEGWYNNEERVLDGSSINSDVILVAHWIRDDIQIMTISFDTNGGSDIDDITIECGTDLDLPTPIRTGYKFLNWYDKNDIFITNEAKLVCEDIELYAKWEKID